MDTLYLLDASGFLYRAYFAIQGLSNFQGESTGALYGFIRSYLKLRDDFQPTSVVAVFDAERNKETRTALFSEYKAHRKPTPDDLIKQINEAQEFCRLMGIPMLAIPGVEADDTIASVATWAEDQGAKVFICTSDKDMMQLISEKIHVINPHKENLIIDAKKAEEVYGIAPTQMRDYLAICGDSSDNVPGIQGFGPKTAIQLLKQYGTLEGIYSHIDEIGGKKKETLLAQKEMAFLSQQLVSVDKSVSFPKEENFFSLREPDNENLWQFLRSKNFSSLLKIAGEQTPEKVESGPACICRTISSLEELEGLLHTFSSSVEICCDTETSDIDPMRADVVGIGLAMSSLKAYYIPFNAGMPKEGLLRHLKPFFENPERHFFGHNIKYDWHVLQNAGINIASISNDTILESYLLNAHQRKHSLDELSLLYFGKQKIATAELLGKGKSQITMAQVPIEKVAEYCCEDVEYTLKLKERLDKEIAARGLKKLLDEVEVPLIKVLGKMEDKGIFVDVEVLAGLSQKTGKEIEILQETIYQLAGEPFNLNSPKQLSEILFIKLGITPLKKGRTMPSTNAEVLESLADKYPIAQKILEYRSLEKLRSTYIETLPQEVNPRTGRIHCQFNQSVAATGRLSCQNPNLQNIPVRSEFGSLIRSAFRPRESSWSFLSADYSQIELRILAHVCQDEGLLEAFQNNVDIHSYTASEIFHVPMGEVTDAMRSQAKAVNFGVIYGQQAFGLSQALNIPISVAAAFIDAYFKRYKRIKEYIESAKEMARKRGKAVSLTGRERLLPDISSSNQVLRTAAERLAVNTPFQAAAADIIKMAMIRIDQWLQNSSFKASMLLQIHDELLFEMPDDELPKVQEGVRKHMEEVFELKVPLKVKIGIGKNWMEC